MAQCLVDKWPGKVSDGDVDMMITRTILMVMMLMRMMVLVIVMVIMLVAEVIMMMVMTITAGGRWLPLKVPGYLFFFLYTKVFISEPGLK